MTKKEFQKLVKAIPLDKRKVIAEKLMAIATSINNVEYDLLNTTLSRCTLLENGKRPTLWGYVYGLKKLFDFENNEGEDRP